ncbi:hypothetical protein CDN99_06550 [Roseateles aquatilis]|uniref:Uncharacterized protein n=1 Tax=Roseateles aquatilis TaxID=431061 RepID=A0A246JHI1_9BURK|nr:hypothetical protein [Roseateles aquatilis]OWQ92012.1 hypothetical protein CDN99_06550 [Roseateles aquatilis]
MTAAYTPQPGTIPFRALAYLRTQPLGKKYSTGELAEAIDVDPLSMGPCLMTAVTAGLISRTKAPGQRWRQWSLGTGAPAAAPAPAADADAEDPADFTPNAPRATAPSANEAALQAWPAQPPAPAPEPPPAEAPAPIAVPPAAPKPRAARQAEPTFACALWSDGRLQLTRGNAVLAQLTADETRALLHYLDRIATPEVPA